VLICATSATKLLDGRETGCWCGGRTSFTVVEGCKLAAAAFVQRCSIHPAWLGKAVPHVHSCFCTVPARRVEEVASPYLLWREKGFQVRPLSGFPAAPDATLPPLTSFHREGLTSCRGGHSRPTASVRLHCNSTAARQQTAPIPPAAPQVDLCSVKGGAIPWDAASCQEGSDFFTPEAQAFYKDGEAGGRGRVVVISGSSWSALCMPEGSRCVGWHACLLLPLPSALPSRSAICALPSSCTCQPVFKPRREAGRGVEEHQVHRAGAGRRHRALRCAVRERGVNPALLVGRPRLLAIHFVTSVPGCRTVCNCVRCRDIP